MDNKNGHIPSGNGVNAEVEETKSQSKSKSFSETDRAWMNTCLVGVLIAFWISVYINGLPTGLGGGKFLAFLHVAVLAGFYKVNKD